MSKLPEKIIWYRMCVSDPDPDFPPIPDPDPGSRGQKNTGSRIQGSKKHRIQDPDPQHCTLMCIVQSLYAIHGGAVADKRRNGRTSRIVVCNRTPFNYFGL